MSDYLHDNPFIEAEPYVGWRIHEASQSQPLGDAPDGAASTEAEPSAAWAVSEVRTVDGTFMVLGGEGLSFGLVADVTTEADAHLIAAAREIHAALKLCVAWIVELAESGDAGFWDAEKMPEVMAARAALAKARQP
jgi:hypothetical protein